MKQRQWLLALGIWATAISLLTVPFNTQAQATATATRIPTLPPPPTNTPRPIPTLPLPSQATLPAPTLATVTTDGQVQTFIIPFRARLCADCLRVRLRTDPGTAGNILGVVPATAQFDVVARSDDGAWVQIQGVDSAFTGWIATEFVFLPNLAPVPPALINALPVGGTTVDASPTPTSNANIPGYLSNLTFNARKIFLHGRELGNQPNVFVRVGDSISASPNFLYPIGSGQIEYGQYGYLATVVGYFRAGAVRGANPFNAEPIAAGGGWSTVQLLQPGYSHAEVCGTDTPLVCEYKLSKPAVALIMIGTNDSGSGSAADFGGNLRQIVQTSIDMGVIPVLSTIPPKRIDEDQTNRVNAYNRVIRQVAAQYEIPLWDYFTAMDALPNGGMSRDGLHPSVPPDGAPTRFSPENLQYGYTLRNLQALQVLDTIWRLVLY